MGVISKVVLGAALVALVAYLVVRLRGRGRHRDRERRQNVPR